VHSDFYQNLQINCEEVVQVKNMSYFIGHLVQFC